MDLKERLKELEELEKKAWADLNFILGRKEELMYIISQEEEKEAETQE